MQVSNPLPINLPSLGLSTRPVPGTCSRRKTAAASVQSPMRTSPRLGRLIGIKKGEGKMGNDVWMLIVGLAVVVPAFVAWIVWSMQETLREEDDALAGGDDDRH
jgi:hypothetical protein